MPCIFCEQECDEYCHPASAKEYHEHEGDGPCTVCRKEMAILEQNPHWNCVGDRL